MTTDTMFAVFANFNDPGDEPAVLVADDVLDPPDNTGEIREQAWTDGYMTGRQDTGSHDSDRVADGEAVDVAL